NTLGVDLADVKLCGVYQCEEASAEGNGEFDLFSVDGHALVLFVYECRYIGKSYAFYLAVFYDSLGADLSCRIVKNYFVLSFMSLYQTSLDRNGNSADGAVSAHVQVSACVHEHYAEVCFLINRLAEKSAEHIVMSSWLKHQSGTNIVVVFLHPFFLLD